VAVYYSYIPEKIKMLNNFRNSILATIEAESRLTDFIILNGVFNHSRTINKQKLANTSNTENTITNSVGKFSLTLLPPKSPFVVTNTESLQTNTVNNANSNNFLFVDASCVYRRQKQHIQIDLINVFNVMNYTTFTVLTNQAAISNFFLRGRMILCKYAYTF
jgi:hypothetical protein